MRAFIAGVTAAATGAIAAASVILGQGAIHDATTVAIAAVSLGALVLLGRSTFRRVARYREPLVVLCAGVIGLLLHTQGL